MSRFALLRNAAEYQAYIKAFIAEQRDAPEERIDCGPAPAGYPCLAASTWISVTLRKVRSCYVYLSDAQQLLEATKQTKSDTAAVPGNDYIESLKSLSAHILALYREMASVGATNEERYEKAYLQSLTLVDQYHAANRDEARLLRNKNPEAAPVLFKLFPEDEPTQ